MTFIVIYHKILLISFFSNQFLCLLPRIPYCTQFRAPPQVPVTEPVPGAAYTPWSPSNRPWTL